MKITKANAKTSMKSLQEPCWGRKRNQYKNMPQEDQQKLKEYRRSYELAWCFFWQKNLKYLIKYSDKEIIKFPKINGILNFFEGS